MFTGRILDAEEALAIGMVNRIVDASQLDQVTRELASSITANAPLTIKATKEMIRRIQANHRLPSDDTHDLITMCYTSNDFKEGVDSFLTKRKPHWTGS